MTNAFNYESPFTRIDVPIRLGQKVRITNKGTYFNEEGIVEEIRVSANGVLLKVVGDGPWRGSLVCPMTDIALLERTANYGKENSIA